MSNYKAYAEYELKKLGYDMNDQEEGPNKWIIQDIFELLDVFERQGHSGSSAPYCINVFKRLALFEPLSPLTGEEDEWNEVDTGVFQNKRASHVFKRADMFNGQAYDIRGCIFRNPDSTCYTSRDSVTQVTFPYTPKSEYVDVDD